MRWWNIIAERRAAVLEARAAAAGDQRLYLLGKIASLHGIAARLRSEAARVERSRDVFDGYSPFVVRQWADEADSLAVDVEAELRALDARRRRAS